LTPAALKKLVEKRNELFAQAVEEYVLPHNLLASYNSHLTDFSSLPRQLKTQLIFFKPQAEITSPLTRHRSHRRHSSTREKKE
jgi:hypothetical protein